MKFEDFPLLFRLFYLLILSKIAFLFLLLHFLFQFFLLVRISFSSVFISVCLLSLPAFSLNRFRVSLYSFLFFLPTFLSTPSSSISHAFSSNSRLAFSFLRLKNGCLVFFFLFLFSTTTFSLPSSPSFDFSLNRLLE